MLMLEIIGITMITVALLPGGFLCIVYIIDYLAGKHAIKRAKQAQKDKE